MRQLFVLVAALGFVAALTPARAAVTRDVAVGSNFFQPQTLRAVAGDTVRWTVQSGGHNVETYGGTMSFESPMMSPASPPYTQTYAGGVVLYRCRPHSSVTSGGTCTGMCGAITDSTAAPATPTITQPASGATLDDATVVFAGTGEPWSTVLLREGDTPLAEAVVQASGSWSASAFMSGGSHTVTAIAQNADGVPSPGSAAVTFTVNATAADTTPPRVMITSDAITAGIGAAEVSGLASDNVAVARVFVSFSPVTGGVARTFAASCPSCAAGSVDWSVRASLPPGVYRATAIAHDSASPPNVSPTAGPVFVAVV